MLKNGLNQEASITSQSEEETKRFAKSFARTLKAGDIVCLKGDLGAGKTTFVKGLAEAFNVKQESVNSPTFVIMNYYKGKVPLYHFDLYRLENPKEVDTLDFDDYFYGDGISLIEWPERLGEYQPKSYHLVEFKHQSETQRSICISYPSKHQPKSSR